MISRLTPRPAAEFSADKINFIIPEIAVTKVQGRWTVRLISRLGSKIRLNDTYAQITSGVSEGDQVKTITRSSSSSDEKSDMKGGMDAPSGGGMQGGNKQGGGMSSGGKQ